jgi:Mrp family chromosome partitioning ATPase
MILANLARASLMIVESYVTRSGALEGSVKRLRSANANILGAVFVKHRRGPAGFGYGYGYGYDYHYSYSYGSTRRGALTGEVEG